MKNKKKDVLTLVLFLLMSLVSFSSLFAGEVTFFQKKYTRSTKKPFLAKDQFTIPAAYAGQGFTLELTNGAPRTNIVWLRELSN